MKEFLTEILNAGFKNTCYSEPTVIINKLNSLVSNKATIRYVESNTRLVLTVCINNEVTDIYFEIGPASMNGYKVIENIYI